jgi:uncharacterized protein
MPYFTLSYELVDDFVARRAPLRQEHLRLVKEAHSRGELLMAGALAEPADRALLVFQCSNRAIPETFAKADPYVANGLVATWEVRPWNNVLGSE